MIIAICTTKGFNHRSAVAQAASILSARFSTVAVDKTVKKHVRLSADRYHAGVTTVCLRKRHCTLAIATAAGIEEPPSTGGRRSNLYQRRLTVCVKHEARVLRQD
jgi:hypothetical protein